MRIDTLKIQNLGQIADLTLFFGEKINVIVHSFPAEIAFAVMCITNNKAPLRWTPPRMSGKTKITASVSVKEMTCNIEIALDEKTDTLVLCAHDDSGKEVTSEYLRLTSHCSEQDISDMFDGDEQTTLLRFLDYKNESDILREQALVQKTGGVFALDSFRHYLAEFIRNFQSELISSDKSYEIILHKNGLYGVRCVGFDDSPVCLSESERKIFQYLCFLKTAEFWCGFEKIRNMHDEKKPLVITNFLERLDDAIDVVDILNKTRKLKRQVILLKKQ